MSADNLRRHTRGGVVLPPKGAAAPNFGLIAQALAAVSENLPAMTSVIAPQYLAAHVQAACAVNVAAALARLMPRTFDREQFLAACKVQP